MAWLRASLTAAQGRDVHVFMHHPPLPLALPAQDTIMLENAGTFLDLIAAYPRVKHLFMGHVHRATSGSVRGIAFATIGALSFQAPPPRPTWDRDHFEASQEAPHCGVLLIGGDSVVLQYTQFCQYEVGSMRGNNIDEGRK